MDRATPTEERGPCEDETEVRALQAQAKEHQAEKSKVGSSFEASERGKPHQHLEFTLPNSRTMRTYISVV